MSDTFMEHRPLLREDIADEEYQYEFSSPRHMGYKGKAKNTVKGAAAIIKNWPDHWTSPVKYWWAAIIMFALITFVFYSSVVTYSMLPTVDSIPLPLTNNRNKLEREQTLDLPKVFMHVIVNNEKEADLNKYLPYVEIVANKYLHYTFNVLVLLNDTFQNLQVKHQAETNNENALNSLWTGSHVLEQRVSAKTKSNINIQYYSLSNYLEDSPLRDFWKELPYQFIEFLVRAVSIWDKGGIAVSPIVLTPKSPDAIYIEKLYSLLLSYEQLKKPNVTMDVKHKIQSIEKPKTLNNHKHVHKKRVNNIQDIIDALETETTSSQIQPEALSEAETKHELTMLETDSKPTAVNSSSFNENARLNKSTESTTDVIQKKDSRSDTLNSMYWPSFLDLLFPDNVKTVAQEDNSTSFAVVKDSMKERSVRAAIPGSIQSNDGTDKPLQPMIVSAPTKFDKLVTKVEHDDSLSFDDLDKLTIDLKGNMLATKSPCHAFLGTMFSNVKHCREKETLKDFIISELSLFCNGLLSTCKGVDVILL